MISHRRSRPPRNTCTASCYASSLIYITPTIPKFSTFARSLTSTRSSPTSWLSVRSTSCWISRTSRDSQALRSGLARYGSAGRKWGSSTLPLSHDVRPSYNDGLLASDLVDHYHRILALIPWIVGRIGRPSQYPVANSRCIS